MKRALLLINIGTPEKPEREAVKKYLSEFLNDELVIDIPWLLRKILVNLIIVPFRTNKSTDLYKRLWTEDGSPLLVYQNKLVDKLNQRGDESGFTTYSAMRYGSPSIKDVLWEIDKSGCDELIVLPMYPQYATSTTLSTERAVNKMLKGMQNINKVRFVKQFYNHPDFIEAFVSKIRSYDYRNYDHILFSYHGLPDRQVNKLHPGVKSHTCSCHKEFPLHGKECYKATCYETTRLMAAQLGVDNNSYSVSFQSRLSNNWLSPFTDAMLESLLKKGKKKILVVAPSFVTDCLETIVEIGWEYESHFKSLGGEKLQLVESLNESDEWVQAIINITN
ncbi:ferrochelatase [Plebeiibacterium marinum]|uniref:Ferrochelatase n=1 Tax=Plebeiibacterium marinum TaxID=2992111 RepID=A0AAE3SLA8_9BACT|nr:ferrochelatase [Plebeiobacterium marinum]MCW3807695.1 ferrochelatase [Plebeiobacterium marinum]